jgi:hypothetical protein
MSARHRLALLLLSVSIGLPACSGSTDTTDPLVCEPGTVMNAAGDACVPADGCTNIPSPCDANATCTDTEAGFECTCNDGFEGNGVTCIPTDTPCAGNPCDANATCTNVDDSFECACNEGFEGDGLTCTAKETCTDESCDANATCVDNEGTIECTCNEGYEGDGLACDLIVYGDLSIQGLPDVSIIGSCLAGTVGTTEAQTVAIDIVLTATGGSLFSDADCATALDSPQSAEGDVTFYAQADQSGPLTITAQSAGFEDASRTVDISPSDYAQDERADATLVVYNANDPEAHDIAVYYAAARGIADDQLCPITMPRGHHATPADVLGARTSIINECFCALLGPETPTPCDVSNLEAIIAGLPITHLVMIRGLPGRMTGTGWPTDSEDPSVDFYLSYLLANDADIFAEDTKGSIYLQYPYLSMGKVMAPALDPKEHGYFAIARIQAMTSNRTMDLIDRTLDSEAKGLQGNIVSETTSTDVSDVPGQYLTSTFSGDCLDYLTHEPFAFDTPESSWPYETCRWGSTGSTAEGSAKQLMPGMVGTTIPQAINVGFFVGKEPFSEPKDNNHSAFFDYNNMLRWRVSDADCLPECDDFESEAEQVACEDASTDWFQSINTDCVGVAPGFMGQQLRSYPVGYYGFIPQGWWAPGGGATEQTAPIIRQDGAFQNETFTDPYYAHFGNADLTAPNEDTCQAVDGSTVPCPERVAVNINRKLTLTTPIDLTNDAAFTIRVRYRNQGSPNAKLRLQLFANNLNNMAAKQADGSNADIDLSESHATWQTAEFEVFIAADAADEITKLRFYLNGNHWMKIRGWIDLDAVEVLDPITGTEFMPGDAQSFAQVKDITNAKGESAADVIDRMNGIAYWGSSSHHLTGGWSFYSNLVAQMLFSGRTLGEATSYSGAKAGIVYGDPLYRGFGVKMYRTSYNNLLTNNPLVIWQDTPVDHRTLYLNTLHGTANNHDLQWELAACTSEILFDCQDSDWNPLVRGHGAVRDHVIDLASLAETTGDLPVFLRIRAWPAGDPQNHLSDYGHVQLKNSGYIDDPKCIYDFNGDGVVNINDYYFAVGFSTCTEEDLKADFTGDGKVNQKDVTYWNFPPDDVGKNTLDVNGDGIVDSDDLNIVKSSQCGKADKQGNINLDFDFDGDGDVDDDDMAKVLDAMGTSGCPCTGNGCP